MKKFLLFIFSFICLLFYTNVYAEDYALNNYGYYSIKEAACHYDYAENYSKIKVLFNDDKLSSIVFYDTNSQNSIYVGTISFQSFFDKNTLEFKCPSELYIMYDVVNNRGSGSGYYIDLGNNLDEEIIAHQTIKLIDSHVTYNAKSEEKENKNTYNVICKLKKVINSSGSTHIQYVSPMFLDYVENSLGARLFVSDNIEYRVTAGSLDCDNVISTNFLIDMDNKTINITNCNDNINSNCVKYERLDYASSQYDGGIKKDGSNDNTSELITPSKIEIYNPNLTPQNCESLFGSPEKKDTADGIQDPAYYLSFAFKVIRYIAIVILIILSTLDFISAVASHDDDELKKATNKTIKRLILCIIIFLLPTLVEFILKYINDEAIKNCIK